MSASRATMLDEFDDHEDDDVPARGTQRPSAEDLDIPDGIAGNPNDRPRLRDGERDIPLEFEMVDADEPAPVRDASDDQIRGDEQPEVEDTRHSRSTGAQRRLAQRQARERESRRIADLTAENARILAELEEFRSFRDSVTPRLDLIDNSRHTERLAGLDREISNCAATVENAIDRMSEAMATGDAEAHKAALRDHTRAIQRGQELQAERNQTATARTAPPPSDDTPRRTETRREPAQPQRIDPIVQDYMADFSSQHPWVKLDEPDLDSEVVLAIDRRVAQRFAPNTPQYWDELEKRMREAPQLAHRFREAPAQRQQNQTQRIPAERRGPMVGAPGGATPGSGTRQVRMSPDRKQALIEVGVLDRDGRTVLDKARFNRIAGEFVAYDRQMGGA